MKGISNNSSIGLKKLLEDFRNNVFCRRESNQRKARESWLYLGKLLPDEKRVGFEIEWSHYLLNELNHKQFGGVFKNINSDIICVLQNWKIKI